MSRAVVVSHGPTLAVVDRHVYRVQMPDGGEYPFEREGRRQTVGEIIFVPIGDVTVREIVQQPESGKFGIVRAEPAMGSRLG